MPLGSARLHGLILGVYILVCVAGCVMFLMVTSEYRSGKGQSAFPIILIALVLAVLGWMALDWFWYPQYQRLPLGIFIKRWLRKTF
ncbi:MAG: hypothetical protein D6679_05990 [Candidatus Hydrogenedentota bacterium]|nr:MAG: hypothetical protein D6679_05990 [Candidatus Hydrogenedentota bacterium]